MAALFMVQFFAASFCLYTTLTVSLLPFLEPEPLSHPENGLSKEDSTKDAAPSTHPSHTTSDYRVTKKERPYYPGHSHTPPPLRRVSSNPTELGQMCPPRRVEGRVTKCNNDILIQLFIYIMITFL